MTQQAIPQSLRSMLTTDHLLLLACSVLASTVGFAVIQATPVIMRQQGGFAGWETVPVACYMAAAAASAWFSNRLLNIVGHTAFFTWGAVMATIGAAAAFAATRAGVVWLVAPAMLVVGLGIGSAQMYKFVAARAVASQHRGKLLSAYTYATLCAAMLAPTLVADAVSKEVAGWHPGLFAGVAIMSLLLCVLTGWVAYLRTFPLPAVATGGTRAQLSTTPGDRPVAIRAAFLGSTANAVMSLLMIASSLQMHVCGLGPLEASTAFQAHFLAMFAPSFATGYLLDRVGVRLTVILGVALNLAAAAIAYRAATFQAFFWFLLLCGLGWNLLFLASQFLVTNALSEAGREQYAGRYQGAVAAATCVTVLAASPLQREFGWEAISAVALLMSAAVLITAFIRE